jgi:hypothetical protein
MPAVDDLQDTLRAVVERHQEVLVAYLFGSVARGTSGPLSDVDVAVLLSDGVDPFAAQLDLMGDIASAIRSDEVDVVVLNTAPVSLAYRVLRDGVLLLSRNDVARIRHRVGVIDRYLDMEPFRRVQSVGLHHRLQEGRFGRS